LYKPYKKPVINAFADVNVPEPKISKLIIFIVTVLSKTYLFILFGFAKIILRSDDILIETFKSALEKKSRVIIAFRHPDGREPQLLTWFFLFRLKKLAARKKIKFPVRPHAIFVYGYEVARWAGAVARYIMPNIGALPIHHTKLDSKGMNRLYSAIINGPYPLALAPEGQVSYSTDSVPRLETGIIRIGFQAADKLAEKNEDSPVLILPLSIHFRYGKHEISEMEKLLKKTEKICGLYNKENKKLSLSQRLGRCREYILKINEKRYGINIDESLSFEERLEKVVNAALFTAEKMLGIKSEGDFFSRLYKVRHECWDRIFVPEIKNLEKIDPVKRSVMDLKAGEAWHIARHQELADFGWYFYHCIPDDISALHKKIEYVQNLWDFANRTMGGALSSRVNIKPAKVIIKATPVINLSESLSQYKTERKKTIAEEISKLEKAYLDCIDEINKTEE